MTYATLLTDESESSKMLVRITPNIRILYSDFTSYNAGAGSTSWRIAWTRGPIRSAYIGNQILTNDSTFAVQGSISLSFYYFWHDEDNGYLYISVPNSKMISGASISIGYDLFFATHPISWHSDPLDTTTDTVEYKPLIVDVPSQKKSVADQMLGYAPIASSNIGLANEDQYFNEMISSHSFNLAPIKCWHFIGDELAVSNMSLFIDSTCSDISTDYSKVNISINSDESFFDKEFRPIPKVSFFDGNYFLNTSEFPNLDPNMVGRPKRFGFGYNKKVKLTNSDYTSTANTETDNATHIMGFSATVSADGSDTNTGLIFFSDIIDYALTTTTRIYFLSAYASYINNFELYDHILVNNSYIPYGGFVLYGGDLRRVINNPSVDGYVEINSAFAFTANVSYVYRFTIPRLYIEINGAVYKPRAGRDYRIQSNYHCEEIVMTSGYVAAVTPTAMPRAINHTDAVYGDWYGYPATTGTAASADYQFNAYLHPVSFLYDFLRYYLRSEYPDTFNTASFSTASDVQPTDRISFVVPESPTQDYPSFKEIITNILISGKLRLFKDENGLWNVQRVDVPSDDTVSISENEAVEFSTEYDYSDITSDVRVEYGYQGRGDLVGQTEEYIYSTSTTAANSDKVKGFYGVSKQQTFRSYHFDSNRAALLLTFLESVFNHRRGTHSIKLGREYFNLSINDLVSITMDRVAGAAYDGTQKTVQGVVTEINKDLNRVQITLDDQTSW